MTQWLRRLRRFPIFIVECAIRFYQVALSPLLIGHCKFIPSCSEYSLQAVREWGVIRGGYLSMRRLLRCHPFNRRGGFDPVPARKGVTSEQCDADR